MKETLLKRQWELEDRIQHLRGEVYRLLSEMYHDPEKAWEHAIETADNPQLGVEGTVAVLNKSPRNFGKPRFPRVGKESREKVTKFRENRQDLIKVLRDVSDARGRLGHVKSGLEEIERTESQDKVKEPSKHHKKSEEKSKEKPQYMTEREAEREAVKKQMQRDEREAQKQQMEPEKPPHVSPKLPPKEEKQKSQEELDMEAKFAQVFEQAKKAREEHELEREDELER